MKNIKEEKTTEIKFEKSKSYIGCLFKRNQKSQWERGLAILEFCNTGSSDVVNILDLDDKIVKKVWNYELDTLSTMVDNHLMI